VTGHWLCYFAVYIEDAVASEKVYKRVRQDEEVLHVCVESENKSLKGRAWTWIRRSPLWLYGFETLQESRYYIYYMPTNDWYNSHTVKGENAKELNHGIYCYSVCRKS